MRIRAPFLLSVMILLAAGPAAADKYDDTIELFQKSGESAAYFPNSYGYAVFHTIGKGAFAVVGTARGKGRVYEHGKLVGNVTLTQVNVGWQLGVQAYSEIIFFQDQRAFQDFTSGDFELGAGVSAVALTAGASSAAGTSTGAHAGASAGKSNAVTAGGYHNGLAVFTIAKGGVMYQATVGGQRFKYKPR